jgi:hypothetical protein
MGRSFKLSLLDAPESDLKLYEELKKILPEDLSQKVQSLLYDKVAQARRIQYAINLLGQEKRDVQNLKKANLELKEELIKEALKAEARAETEDTSSASSEEEKRKQLTTFVSQVWAEMKKKNPFASYIAAMKEAFARRATIAPL